MISFKIKHQDGAARTGSLTTSHGLVRTPFFMPVATAGVVKTLSPAEVKELGFELVLANTYHLYLRPGEKLIKKLGGIHKFTGIDLPFLTDSGGYQVFSLGHKTGNTLAALEDHGVRFKSHLDGGTHYFTPKKVIDIQRALGVDIMMPLDDCPSSVADPKILRASLTHTHAWIKEAYEYWDSLPAKNKPALFGIVQGGTDARLRAESLAAVTQYDLSGFALGGLAVGEGKAKLYQTVARFADKLPAAKPRYLMGVGEPADIIWAISCGIDMFDCVLPTRLARHGSVWIVEGPTKMVQAFWEGDTAALLAARGKGINILRRTFPKAEHSTKGDLIQPQSNKSPLFQMSFAYANHLAKLNEISLFTAFTKQNLLVLNKFIQHARYAITRGQLDKLALATHTKINERDHAST